MKLYDKLLGHDPSSLYNSTGHRSRELQDINLRNYLLFAGDNISLGLDKPIEETYPHIVSSLMNMDYYNLSLFNGGIDAIKYNLLIWNSIVPVKPKAVIVSSEFLNAFLVSDKNYSDLQPADLKDEKVQSVLSSGNTTQYFPARRMLADKLIRNSLHVPIYQISFGDKLSLFSDGVFNIDYDNKTVNHFDIANLVVNAIKKNTSRILP